MLRFLRNFVATIIVVLAASGGTASAITYTYVGGSYEGQTSNDLGECCNPYHGAFGGSITLTESLQPGTTTEVVRWSTYYPYTNWTGTISPLFIEASFSNVFGNALIRRTASIHLPPIFSPWSFIVLSLTTDSQGAIVDWLIDLAGGDSRSALQEWLRSSGMGDSAKTARGPYTYTATAGPGTWTVAAVPVPAGIALLGSALGILILAGWRQKTTSAA